MNMGKNQHLEDDKVKSSALNIALTFYKFLTPQISESVRLEEFANWHRIDKRTLVKYLEGQTRGRPKQNAFNNSSEYLKSYLNFLNPQRLWKSLEIICRFCGVDCYGSTPANGCIHCKRCIHIKTCERKKGTDIVPEDCKILKDLFSYVDEIENLPDIYSPLKYVFDRKYGFAVDTLDVYKSLLEKALGEKIDIKYVSCVIRYAHLYDSSNKVSFLFLSRMFPEEILERVLVKITPEPIDDIRVQLWNKCNKFEKELSLAQKSPERGTIDTLFQHIKNDVSLADIIIFARYFSVLPDDRLRSIDVRILQKCLCWKDCSLENFFQLCRAELA